MVATVLAWSCYVQHNDSTTPASEATSPLTGPFTSLQALLCPAIGGALCLPDGTSRRSLASALREFAAAVAAQESACE